MDQAGKDALGSTVLMKLVCLHGLPGIVFLEAIMETVSIGGTGLGRAEKEVRDA